MTKESNKTQGYIPGMCNINKAEVAYRRKAMYAGLAITILLLIVLVFFQVNIFLRSALLFVPLYIAFIGYLQVQNKFCVSYGASGKQNATDDHVGAENVAEKSARAADKAKARKMNLQALVATIVVLLILLLVPASKL